MRRSADDDGRGARLAEALAERAERAATFGLHQETGTGVAAAKQLADMSVSTLHRLGKTSSFWKAQDGKVYYKAETDTIIQNHRELRRSS